MLSNVLEERGRREGGGESSAVERGHTRIWNKWKRVSGR